MKQIRCPKCGKELKNTKALGSHMHYVHESYLIPILGEAGRSVRQIQRLVKDIEGLADDCAKIAKKAQALLDSLKRVN